MGPSKEELANYFKNNRKYFDELAQHYKRSDPSYYNTHIVPFYSLPFISVRGKRTAKPAIAVFAAAMSVFIMGIVLFFMVNQKNIDDDFNLDKEEIENEIESDQVKMLDTLSAIKDLGDYEKGIMYYKLGEYDKAEKFLEKVPEGNALHKDAKLKLIEIKKKKSDTK